jgi:hypothetical protein
VRRLADRGYSHRRIADEVFSDVRYRGRVERILRSKRRALPDIDQLTADAELGLDNLLGDDMHVPTLRELVDRYKRSLAMRGDSLSLVDLERLQRLEQRLATMEQLERLNALTRDPAQPG